MQKAVLIAGAGPVGLTMAAELTRYGVPVRIIDKAPERTDKSKALVIWPRTLELLERSGSVDAFIAAGLKVESASIIVGDKRIGHVALEKVASHYPYALMIPQSETERLLEALLTRLGAKVERSWELTGFSASGEGVRATLRHSDGHDETADFSWLIGCDGAHSTVRHQLGLEFEGEAIDCDWVLADVHLTGIPAEPEIQIYWHADGILALFPIQGTRWRVIADVGPQGSQKGDPTLEEIQRILDVRGPGNIKASDPVWIASFHINDRKVANYRAGRVFLAGDAAHIHSPAGGQGMNTGMQDAFNLAWKLALSYRDRCTGELLLESYSAERSAVGKQVVEGAGYATQLAMLRGGAEQAIRNHVASFLFGFAPVRQKMADVLTELSVGYAHSPINGHGGHGTHGHGAPAEGERAPIREGEEPVGAGSAPKFVLFSESDGAGANPLSDRFGEVVEAKLRAPFEPGGLWLVRPDGYVALAEKRGEFTKVQEYLARVGAGAAERSA